MSERIAEPPLERYTSGRFIQRTGMRKGRSCRWAALAAGMLLMVPGGVSADVVPPGMLAIRYVGDSFGIHPTLWHYALYFFWTCVIESPAYAFALRMHSWGGRALAVVVLNAATHPLVYFVFPLLTLRLHWSPWTNLLSGESFAVVVEAVLLWRIRRSGSFIAALSYAFAANLASFGFGFIYKPFPYQMGLG